MYCNRFYHDECAYEYGMRMKKKAVQTNREYATKSNINS